MSQAIAASGMSICRRDDTSERPAEGPEVAARERQGIRKGIQIRMGPEWSIWSPYPTDAEGLPLNARDAIFITLTID
jgi:hypothetical protein